VGIETKKSAARSAKVDARPAVVRAGQGTAAKRPSAAPPAKKKSVPPPAAAAANDNDKAPEKAPKVGKAAPAAQTTTMGGARGRLPTGSLHTEAREPAQAADLKARLTALMNAQQKLAELKRSANKHFYEIGEVLHRVREQRLFEVKGYGSFEAYLDREVNLGQQFCATAVRIFETFLPAAAAQLGLARLSAAIRAIDDTPTGTVASEASRGARSPIPPHKL
jgi:hypothetical protein